MLRMTKSELARMFGNNPEKPKKYGNHKCEWDGIEFDSKRERDRYIFLESEMRAGRISDLQRQVRYQLIPAQRIDGKLVEREICYVADFVYRNASGETVVEDAKGYRENPVWIIKRKLMLWVHGIRVLEV